MSTDARRAQLLRCAVEASADVGIARVGHIDVAKRAKVAVPTVFSYFPTRKALVKAILKDVRRFYLDLLASVSCEGSARDVVFAMFWDCTRRARSDPHYIRVWLDWSTAIRHETWPQYLTLWNDATAVFEAILERGQREGNIDRRLDRHIAAQVLLGGAHTVAVMIFSGVDDERLEAIVRHMVDGAINVPLQQAPRSG